MSSLTGKNGISKLLEIFKDFKFHGKGYEKHDLDLMLLKYEHWAHVMHPKYPFMQVVDRIEFLGMKKRPVKTLLKKIRLGIEENVVTDEHNMDRGDSEDENERRNSANHDGDDVPGPDDVLEDDWQADNNDDFPDDDDDLFAAIDADLEQSSKNKAEIAARKENSTDEATRKISPTKTPAMADSSDDDDVNVSQARSRKQSSLESKRRILESSDEDDDELLKHSQSDKASVLSKDSQSSSTQNKDSDRTDNDHRSAIAGSNSEDESIVPNTVSRITDDNSSSDESDYALLSHDTDSVVNSRASPDIKQASKSKRRPQSSTKSNVKSSKKVLQDKNDGVTKVNLDSTNTSQNKRRRIKAFDDDEEEGVGDMSVSEESDLEMSDEEMNQKPGKRRRVESSSDEGEEPSTPKEVHKRRVIVSDSDEDD